MQNNLFNFDTYRNKWKFSEVYLSSLEKILFCEVVHIFSIITVVWNRSKCICNCSEFCLFPIGLLCPLILIESVIIHFPIAIANIMLLQLPLSLQWTQLKLLLNSILNSILVGNEKVFFSIKFSLVSSLYLPSH